MPLFYSTINAAAHLGISRREFERVSTDAGIKGLNFGKGDRLILKWTIELINQVQAYRERPRIKPVFIRAYPRKYKVAS